MSAAFIKPRLARRMKQMPIIASAITALVLAIAWYVLATNAYVAKQYDISDSTYIREDLAAEIEHVQTRLAAVATPEALEAHASELGFVRIANPRYLAVPGSTVAKR